MTWRLLSDQRAFLVAGRTLVMQVAHPVVGAGVRDHSDFRADPWARLDGTLRSLNRLVFAPEEKAMAEGVRLRKMHRAITGVDANGRPYRALDPDAYLWVHATLWEGAVAMCSWFGRPLTGDERERFYQEWREIGRRLGIAARRLPTTSVMFGEYIDDVIDRELTRTAAVDEVLGTIAHPTSPLPLGIAHPLWDAAVMPAGHVLHVVTVGTLPHPLRRRLGLRWSPAHEIELRTVAASVRTGWPVLPAWLRRSPAAQRLSARNGNSARTDATRAASTSATRTVSTADAATRVSPNGSTIAVSPT